MIRAERKGDGVEVVVLGSSSVVLKEMMALIDGLLEKDETRGILAIAVAALISKSSDIDDPGKPVQVMRT